MKKLSYLLLMLPVLALTTFAGCSKGDDGGDDGTGGGDTPTVTSQTLSAKWNIAGNGIYKSFEFNESGNYIVVEQTPVRAEDNEKVYFGKYTLQGNTITMTGFGKLVVKSIDDKSASFTLTREGGQSAVELTTSKSEEMPKTTKTDLLCRTWEIVDEKIPGLEGDYLAETDPDLTVLFSRAGTYLVHNEDFEETGGVGLAQWKWIDSSETGIFYTWTWDVWEDDCRVEIYELTKDRVVFIEKFSSGPDEISVMKPVK